MEAETNPSPFTRYCPGTGHHSQGRRALWGEQARGLSTLPEATFTPKATLSREDSLSSRLLCSLPTLECMVAGFPLCPDCLEAQSQVTPQDPPITASYETASFFAL